MASYGPLEKEQEAFDSQLSELMNEHAGQFVVFKGGRPVGFYPTFNDAYRDALKRFGVNEYFLLSEVKMRGPVPLPISFLTGNRFGPA